MCLAVYPLLKYEPPVLAVTAIVCGAKLISPVADFDEHLNAGLADLVGVSVKATLECRREVQEHINLQNLVVLAAAQQQQLQKQQQQAQAQAQAAGARG